MLFLRFAQATQGETGFQVQSKKRSVTPPQIGRRVKEAAEDVDLKAKPKTLKRVIPAEVKNTNTILDF